MAADKFLPIFVVLFIVKCINIEIHYSLSTCRPELRLEAHKKPCLDHLKLLVSLKNAATLFDKAKVAKERKIE